MDLSEMSGIQQGLQSQVYQRWMPRCDSRVTSTPRAQRQGIHYHVTDSYQAYEQSIRTPSLLLWRLMGKGPSMPCAGCSEVQPGATIPDCTAEGQHKH